MPALDLPDPKDEVDEKLLADVREYGWHFLDVRNALHPEHEPAPGPAAEVPFGYTAGLWLTLDHPEIIVVGGWEHAHAFVSNVVEWIREGRRFAPGDTAEEVLVDLPVRFGAVSDANRTGMLTYADWANRRRPFEALQLVLPDPHGNWPWEPVYHGLEQPLLD